MTSTNTKIRIASIIYLFISVLLVPYAPPLGALLMIPGAILLANSFLPLEELKRNKVSLIIVNIISFLINIPAAVLITLSLDEISSVKLERTNAPPTTESKRIDLLLKLGLLMILVSGILFATTTWEIISNLIKVFALVGMGIAFIGLSKFSEVKLKIASTTKAYFVLGLSFFLLTWVGVGYFGVISPWFSYTGDGKNVVYFITFILLATFLYLINNKFKEQEYLYMGHLSIYLSIYHALASIGLDLLSVALILSVISLIINIIPNNKLFSTVKNINYPISYLFTAVLLTQAFHANKYIVLATCLVNIINVLILALTRKNKLKHILSILISYILLIIGVLKVATSLDTVTILFASLSVFSLLIKYQRFEQSKSLISSNQILYNLIIAVLVMASFQNEIRTLIISSIYLIIGLINSLDLYKTNDKVDFRYLPITIFIFTSSLLFLISERLANVGELLSFSLATFVSATIYHLSKKEETKKYYFVVLVISVICSFLFNFVYNEIVPAIINLLLTIYLFFTRKKEENGIRTVFYIATLANIYFVTQVLACYEISLIITNIICLSIFALLSLLVTKETFKTINYISIVIPLYSLVYTIDMAENLKLLLTNVFWLYLLFLFMKFIIKNKNARDWIGTIGISLIVLSVVFQADILIGIYIGVLSILIIFITFNEEHYKKLFYTGIIITIVNIVVQLWEFWTQIPFYLYLLLVGIGIIVFVTYKELHKKEEPKKLEEVQNINNQPLNIPEEKFKIVDTLDAEESPSKETPQEKTTVQFCPNCGTKNNGGKFCGNCGANLQR
jgi:hypothetical protein